MDPRNIAATKQLALAGVALARLDVAVPSFPSFGTASATSHSPSRMAC